MLTYIKNYISNNSPRNPLLVLNDIRLGIIGDVHLGKSFKTGVPKDRLGEREEKIYQKFVHLLKRDVDYVVVVGDLFDKIRVSNYILYKLINTIEEEAKRSPNKKIIILNGNHDMPKDVDVISSFILLKRYFQSIFYKNVFIITDHQDKCLHIEENNNITFYFSPYNPYISLDDEDIDLEINTDHTVISFGHWETIDFGSDHYIDRCVPNKVLDVSNLVVTGHCHKPSLTVLKDIPVYTVGSIEPLAFNEEIPSDGNLYVTLKLQDYLEKVQKDSEYFKDSSVRLLIEASDSLPDMYPCLSRTFKNITTPAITVTDQSSKDVEIDTSPLSFHKEFIAYLDSTPIDDDMSDFVKSIQKAFLDKNYKDEL